MIQESLRLLCELEHQVQTRTGRRIRQLAIELRAGGVIIHGLASSYYVKQLAQHGIRDLLPNVQVENAITVDQEVSLVG
jgi:hypothetical protein